MDGSLDTRDLDSLLVEQGNYNDDRTSKRVLGPLVQFCGFPCMENGAFRYNLVHNHFLEGNDQGFVWHPGDLVRGISGNSKNTIKIRIKQSIATMKCYEITFFCSGFFARSLMNSIFGLTPFCLTTSF